MNLESKKTLTINLADQTFDVNNNADLYKYVGGLGLALKLMRNDYDFDPLIFAVGPLNGFFPYASKTCVLINDSGAIEDLYFGGGLSSRLKFSGLDAIVITGDSPQPVVLEISQNEVLFKPADTELDSIGFPGKRSLLQSSSQQNPKALLDGHFMVPEQILESKLSQKKITGMIISATETYKIKNFSKYEKLYGYLLKRSKDLTVASGNNPSCSGCPMGCTGAKFGEIGGNVLLHSLVACKYAENIYTDLGIIFSCLNTLGYKYAHEDLENLPKYIKENLEYLS